MRFDLLVIRPMIIFRQKSENLHRKSQKQISTERWSMRVGFELCLLRSRSTGGARRAPRAQIKGNIRPAMAEIHRFQIRRRMMADITGSERKPQLLEILLEILLGVLAGQQTRAD